MPLSGGSRHRAELKIAFTAEVDRTQRRFDGTFSLKGIRFEIPSRYNHFQRLDVRAAFGAGSLRVPRSCLE